MPRVAWTAVRPHSRVRSWHPHLGWLTWHGAGRMAAARTAACRERAPPRPRVHLRADGNACCVAQHRGGAGLKGLVWKVALSPLQLGRARQVERPPAACRRSPRRRARSQPRGWILRQACPALPSYRRGRRAPRFVGTSAVGARQGGLLRKRRVG